MNRAFWSWLWPVLITVSAISAGYAMFVDSATSARPIISIWFLLFCPGLAFVPLLKLKEGIIIEATLTLGLSIAINLLVGELILYLGLWSSKGVLAVIVIISLVGALIQVWAEIRQRSVVRTMSEGFNAPS